MPLPQPHKMGSETIYLQHHWRSCSGLNTPIESKLTSGQLRSRKSLNFQVKRTFLFNSRPIEIIPFGFSMIFFFKKFGGTEPFYGTSVTPVSGFLKCLQWVSKPRLLHHLYMMHSSDLLLCITCSPLSNKHGSQASLSAYYSWIKHSIDGSWTRTHSVRQTGALIN